jgi:parallel beta-helix repeat protein
MEGDASPDWKGALILDETVESVRKRRRKAWKWFGALMLIYAIPWIITMVASLWASVNILDILIMLIFVLASYGIVAVLVIMQATKPFRFYENALVVQQPFGQQITLPYSDFETIAPPKWYRPTYYLFIMKKKVLGIRTRLPIPADIEGLQEKLDIIALRITNCPPSIFKQPDPTPESRKRLRTAELAAYASSYLIAIIAIVALFLSITSPPPGAEFMILALGFFFASLITPLLLFVLAQFLIALAKNSPKYRSDKLCVAGFSFVLALCIVSAPAGLLMESSYSKPVFAPDMGAAPSVSTLTGNLSDASVYPDGDILVDGAMVLRNVTVTMADGAQLWVSSSGELRMERCTLSSNGTFKFRVLGNLAMENCSVADLWGVIHWPKEYGGIEIYGGNASILNSTITDALSRAIMVSGARAEIINCTIINPEQEGIILLESSSVIKGNNISGAETGILVWESTGVEITGNTLSSNDDGVLLTSSDANITGNVITDTASTGVGYDGASHASISNNTYRGNGYDAGSSGDSDLSFCALVGVVESVVVMAVLIYQGKRLKSTR